MAEALLNQLTPQALKGSLNQAIAELAGPSNFACSETNAALPNPGLTVFEYGDVGLPLADRDAKGLIASCHKSAFGKCSETLVDETVRRSWELNASQFRLRNPAWAVAVNSLLPTIHKELGLLCPLRDVRAEPYKLLLYEEGAFFKPHQGKSTCQPISQQKSNQISEPADSEKTPGMFGTLVIALPSLHQGGDLVLRLNQEEIVIKTSTASEFGFLWASWYSDVFHEVKPVTEGYRLVITYNLAINTASGSKVHTVPPTYGSYISRIKLLLQIWNSAHENGRKRFPRYLIHKFDHQYTLASLGLDLLKGADKARAECIKAAASETGASVFLATAELEIIKNDDEYYENEEIDRVTRLKEVRALDGTLILEEMVYSLDEMLNETKFDEDDPDDEEHSGFTGNEGSTATYWYRDTVCIIVPQATVDAFMFDGPDKWQRALQRLQQLRLGLGSGAQISSASICFCHYLLEQNPVSGFGQYAYWSDTTFDTREKPAQEDCVKEIASIALESNRLELFNAVLPRMQGPVPLECFYHLGRLLTSSQSGEANKLIPRMLNSCEGVATKYQAFEKISKGFKDNSQSLPQATAEVRTTSLEKTILPVIFASNNVLSKPDGIAFATVFSQMSDHSNRAQIQGQISQASMAAKIGFCTHLAALVQQQHLDDGVHWSIVNVLCDIWSDFRLDNALVEPNTALGQLLNGAAEKLPTGHDIVELIRLAQTYENGLPSVRDHGTVIATENTPNGLLGLTTDDCASKILVACERANPKDIVATLLPFLGLLASKQVPSLLVEEKPTVAAAKIGTTTIQRFFSLAVGNKPECPKTWAMPRAMSCSCRDCCHINDFIVSPTERVGRFPMGKERRRHAESTFIYKRPNEADYAIETITGCSPNIWQMTKNRTTHNIKLKEWNTRAKFAWTQLSQAFLAPANRKLVEELIGADMYKAIKAKDHRPLLVALPAEPLTSLDVNHVRGKRAQPTDGLGSTGSAKRQASGESRAPLQVIDLTEE